MVVHTKHSKTNILHKAAFPCVHIYSIRQRHTTASFSLLFTFHSDSVSMCAYLMSINALLLLTTTLIAPRSDNCRRQKTNGHLFCKYHNHVSSLLFVEWAFYTEYCRKHKNAHIWNRKWQQLFCRWRWRIRTYGNSA